MLGWSNIELISDRKFEVMLDELKQLKQEYPDRILIASIMARARPHSCQPDCPARVARTARAACRQLHVGGRA